MRSAEVRRLTLGSVELLAVSIPLRRPVVSKVGLFDRWPLVLIDLHTEEGIVGRSYLDPYLEQWPDLQLIFAEGSWPD
jgi:mandelate racemase